MIYLYVAAGGAIGAILRWLEGPWVAGWAGGAFPWGTLFINAGGSLLIGFLLRWLPARGARLEVRAFFAVGICGGYTTFSTYAFETVSLAASGRLPAALAYAAASVVLCLAATFAGFALGGAAAQEERAAAAGSP
ncbi:MAG: camphor resistance protein CrcB [Gemmatimonadetes bacterium]|nr:camphor resistance protein CrcB [Gemmatimonadota bacterium]